jgi:hypothetical protein
VTGYAADEGVHEFVSHSNMLHEPFIVAVR